MTRKQLLVTLCGTAALALVVLLMTLLPAGRTLEAANLEPEAVQAQDTDGTSGLSGGNDCYCIPDQSQTNPDEPAQATE